MDGQPPISADQDDDAVSFGVGYRAHGRVAVIALPERVETACILALASRSERALHAGTRAIAVDLRATHHIGTHTLSELGIALLRISRQTPALAVVGADPRVRWVLELCDIKGLALHATIGDALAQGRAGVT
ncbi:MAG: hypothetical protein ACRDK8_11145 [Solirubrobacteraceae bacterium]